MENEQPRVLMAQKVCNALNTKTYSSVDGLYIFLFGRLNRALAHPMPVHDLDIWALSDTTLPDLSESQIEFAHGLSDKLHSTEWAQPLSITREILKPIKPDTLLEKKPSLPLAPDSHITIDVADDASFATAHAQLLKKRKRLDAYKRAQEKYVSDMSLYQQTVQYTTELEKYQAYRRDLLEQERYESEKATLGMLNDEFERSIELMTAYSKYLLVQKKNQIIRSDPQDRKGLLRQLVSDNQRAYTQYKMQLKEYHASRITANGLKVDDIILTDIKYGKAIIQRKSHTKWIETYDGGGSGMGRSEGYTKYIPAGPVERYLSQSVLTRSDAIQCVFAVRDGMIISIDARTDNSVSSTITEPLTVSFRYCET